jgi:hypothetical protein
MLIIGSSMNFGKHNKTHISPEYVRYADEITNQFIKEMKKEHGLICIGSGGGHAL